MSLMTIQRLEKIQVLIYLAAILCGGMAATLVPHHAGLLEAALWPTLGLLLYVTFTQVQLSHMREALLDGRFLTAAIVGNFVFIPLALWLSLPLLPAEPAVRLGVVMVLLVPCTDWFITFTQLGGGDTRRAIAFAPISLLLQILLLPVYLVLFFGGEAVVTLASGDMIRAFFGLIVLPFALAFATQKWVEAVPGRVPLLERAGWLPIPLLALVILIIAASQFNLVAEFTHLFPPLLLVFAVFLFGAAVLAKVMTFLGALNQRQGRVLAFSFGTRNSFVVLPLALALPPSYELVAIVIVFQSLVELVGMAAYLWLVPRWLFRNGKVGSE